MTQYIDEDDWYESGQEFSSVLNPDDYTRLGGGTTEIKSILTPEEKAIIDFKVIYSDLTNKDIDNAILTKLKKLNLPTLNMGILAHVVKSNNINDTIKMHGNVINKYDLVRYYQLYYQ